LGTASCVADESLDQLLCSDATSLSGIGTGSSLDDEILGEFRAEAFTHLESIEGSMDRISEHLATSSQMTVSCREEIRSILNSVHTLKGASAVFGLHEIVTFGNLLENVLANLVAVEGNVETGMTGILTDSLEQLAIMVMSPENIDSLAIEQCTEQLQRYATNATLDSEQSPLDGEDLLTDCLLNVLEPAAVTLPEKKPAAPISSSASLFSDEEQQLLREGFLEEADEHFQELHQSLEILGREIDCSKPITVEHREEIRKIRRSVHTIKGASAVIGLTEIASYAHRVEDCLDWFYESAQDLEPSMIGSLVESIDVLQLLVESPQTVDTQKQAVVLQRLLALSNQEIQKAKVTQDDTKPDEVIDVPVLLEQGNEIEETIQRARPVTESAKTIRINQVQLDTLVNLSNELLVGVSGFDKNIAAFQTALEELSLASQRIKDIALELETTFEVKALAQLSRHFEQIDRAVADMKASQSFAEFDAMELDRYTQLNLIIRSLNESAIDVSAIQTNMGGVYSGIVGDISRQHRVIRELQMQIMRARMSPMSVLTARLNRTTRDVASRLGRQVRLSIEGERVELDRMVWEKLADPLMHLVRNAVHHGIESDKERQLLGKPEVATLTLVGRREGNNIVIQFSDDGQGLDFEAIREKARRFGLGEKVDDFDEQQLTDLIFYPGFSTKTISEISGRGVGMDVIRENVRELQGTLSVETRQGHGTTFTMRIPLTLGVVRALLVKVNNVSYGIALNDIHGIHRLEQGKYSFENGTCLLADEELPIYSLPRLLEHGDDETLNQNPLVLTLEADGRTVALAIPQISGQKEIVIKGLGQHLGAVPGISGAAIMGDGSVVPVLHVPDLIQADMIRSGRGQALPIRLEIPKLFTVMIVDDSISIRRVMSRLVASQGWVPVEAKDGVDAVQQLEAGELRPDCIVLDIEMPRMNGFEFLAKLPNFQKGQRIPVIMLTSRSSAKHQEKAYQLGADAFLNKPCKDEEFVETVLKLTGHNAPTPMENRREALA
jgi:chemosensory pili system protein ChpA (sensor histidine kinase/response regulator)